MWILSLHLCVDKLQDLLKTILMNSWLWGTAEERIVYVTAAIMASFQLMVQVCILFLVVCFEVQAAGAQEGMFV